jgi:hypothetical protein
MRPRLAESVTDSNLKMNSEVPESRSRFKAALVFSMLFAILGAVVVFGYYTTFRRPVTTVIVVRHAEKIIDPNNPDVDLSEAGYARAQQRSRESLAMPASMRSTRPNTSARRKP